MFSVVLDAVSLERECAATLDAIEAAIPRAFEHVAEMTARAARARHWYRNRTGDLQASTQAHPLDLDGWSDGVAAVVAASEPYAGFVNARRPILTPAWEAIEASATHAFEATLSGALRG